MKSPFDDLYKFIQTVPDQITVYNKYAAQRLDEAGIVLKQLIIYKNDDFKSGSCTKKELLSMYDTLKELMKVHARGLRQKQTEVFEHICRELGFTIEYINHYQAKYLKDQPQGAYSTMNNDLEVLKKQLSELINSIKNEFCFCLLNKTLMQYRSLLAPILTKIFSTPFAKNIGYDEFYDAVIELIFDENISFTNKWARHEVHLLNLHEFYLNSGHFKDRQIH